MNRNIINDTSIYLGIDTLQVQSQGASRLTNTTAPYINKTVTVDNDLGVYSYRLNPDKANNNLAIYSNSEFERVFCFMIMDMSIDNPKITRVDFRFDSFEDNFDRLLKLNKVITLLISIIYKMENRYQSKNPLTQDNLTIRVQNHRLEVENYNKGIQEPNGIVKNRLELRSKNLNLIDTKMIKAEYDKWIQRLDKAITKENFVSLQKMTNDNLVETYSKEKIKFTLQEFICRYCDSIYTTRQLSELVEALGVNNPQTFSKNFKRRHNLETFCYKDLALYVNKIKNAGEEFFNS